MRALILAALVLMTITPSARAADGREIFGQIVTGIVGEIERKHQKRQRRKDDKRMRPVFEACGRGDLSACQQLMQHPRLLPQARTTIQQHLDLIKNAAGACDNGRKEACDNVLYSYPDLPAEIRSTLMLKRNQIVQQEAAHQLFLQNWNLCLQQRKPDGCAAALQHPNLLAANRTTLQAAQTEILERIRQTQATAERIAASHVSKVSNTGSQRAASSQPRHEPVEPLPSNYSTATAYGESQRNAVIIFMVILASICTAFYFTPKTKKDAFVNREIERHLAEISRIATQSHEPQVPVAPTPPSQPATDKKPSDMLTGHFPTDVRNALASMSPEASHG